MPVWVQFSYTLVEYISFSKIYTTSLMTSKDLHVRIRYIKKIG